MGNIQTVKKMVADMQKLLLRAFNAECDDVIEHVKYNNVETAEKRITSSQEAITKLGTIMGVSIVPSYYRLKLEELYLAFEYAQKKQEEKEEQREARAQMREEAKLAREIEEARKKLSDALSVEKRPKEKAIVFVLRDEKTGQQEGLEKHTRVLTVGSLLS